MIEDSSCCRIVCFTSETTENISDLRIFLFICETEWNYFVVVLEKFSWRELFYWAGGVLILFMSEMEFNLLSFFPGEVFMTGIIFIMKPIIQNLYSCVKQLFCLLLAGKKKILRKKRRKISFTHWFLYFELRFNEQNFVFFKLFFDVWNWLIFFLVWNGICCFSSQEKKTFNRESFLFMNIFFCETFLFSNWVKTTLLLFQEKKNVGKSFWRNFTSFMCQTGIIVLSSSQRDKNFTTKQNFHEGKEFDVKFLVFSTWEKNLRYKLLWKKTQTFILFLLGNVLNIFFLQA